MIYVHMADGFEEIEAITVVDLLRRAEIEVNTVSIMSRKQVSGAHGVEITCDKLFEDADYDECSMIVLPGGGAGADKLDRHKGLIEKIKYFDKKGRWIAAICAAPMILGHHDLLKGRKATIYKGMESELIGGSYVDEKVVVDGNITTSQGPATAMDFALKIIELIKGNEEASAISEALLKD